MVPGKSAYPVGKITLEVALGYDHDSRAEKLTFEVVKIKSPYHALFGRLAYAKFMARPCYVYLQIKMPDYKGTITMHENRKIALDCEEGDAAFVGDITIGYDPPRRGRAIPLAVHNDKAHEDVEDGGSRNRLTEGPKPKGDLRPTGINCIMFNLYAKESLIWSPSRTRGV